MNGRAWYLIGMLALLFVANLFMLMGMTNWPQRTREGFAAAIVNGSSGSGSGSLSGATPVGSLASKKGTIEQFMDALVPVPGSAFATAPIGSYDGMNLAAGLPPAAQGFRQNHPDVPLAGPPVEIGPDNLFYFKNNQCKPECCGATLSCDGGCVCTTPQQRDFINTRGGNRSRGGDF
jgi:hypothetical protein